MKKVGLRAKIIRVYALQVLLISLATLLGIYLSNSIVQDVLMRGALEGEATHYWELYRENPNQPLPNTDNLVGYMALRGDAGTVPVSVHRVGHEPGYHRSEFEGHEQIVHVSDQGDARLYLVFDSASVSDLALFFGIVPLSIVLLLVYGLMLFAYRMSQRAVSPIVKLANYLENFEFGEQNTPPLELAALRGQSDIEAATMIEALEHFTARVNAFVDRERVFTRDASHELRTPVAVFKGSLDLLEKDQSRNDTDTKALTRMRRTVSDMEGLIETLLLLASEEQPPKDHVHVNALMHRTIDSLNSLADKSNNKITVEERAQVHIDAPLRVVQILITNLLRNAIAYTQDGTITVGIDHDSISVTDTGIGMSKQDLERAFDPFYRSEAARETGKGHGLGLSIVRRLIEQYAWSIETQSEPGEGTTIRVHFQSEALGSGTLTE